MNPKDLNNVDMTTLINMLSKMDKKDLQSGLAKVSQMLNSNPPKEKK